MNYIAMIVAGIVLGFAAYRGYRAGIIRMILYVAALVITIVLTGFFVKTGKPSGKGKHIALYKY